MRIRVCLTIVCTAAVASALMIVPFGCGKGVKRINGGGATFVDPIMQKWSSVYNAEKGIEIDYKKSGSGNGIQQMTARTLDFGCTDAPMSKEQTETAQKEGGEVIHVPVVMGSVVMVYNLPSIEKQLVLDGKTVADIYLGNIRKWDHEAIAALNPGVKLPPIDIVPVYRAESSGTSKIFTEYLAKASEAFAKSNVGVSTEPKWPKIGLGQQGSDGVAGFVKNDANVGSIGYVEIYYAQTGGIKYAKLVNKKGNTVSAEEEGAVAAAAEAGMAVTPTKEPYTLHELTFSLTDTEGEKAYPICGISYAILYKKQPKDKGKVIVDFLKWATSDGQKYSKELGYAPMPDELRKKIHARLDQVQLD